MKLVVWLLFLIFLLSDLTSQGNPVTRGLSVRYDTILLIRSPFTDIFTNTNITINITTNDHDYKPGHVARTARETRQHGGEQLEEEEECRLRSSAQKDLPPIVSITVSLLFYNHGHYQSMFQADFSLIVAITHLLRSESYINLGFNNDDEDSDFAEEDFSDFTGSFRESGDHN